MKVGKYWRHFDWQLLFSIIIISLLSFLILFSINQTLAFNQLKYLIFGLILFFIFANFDYQILKQFSSIFFIFSLFLLLFTFIFGNSVRGSVRWLKIGSFGFQPSELVKPFFILFFASIASKTNFSKIKHIIIFFIFFLLSDFLIFKQPDLGSSLVVLAIWLGIILAAGVKKSYLVLSLIIFIPSCFLVWRFLQPYQQQRIISFINPEVDPLGAGYHLLQAKITVGSGQFWGQGIGKGIQNQLKFLPERQTDFIFASFSEEFGFLGSTILFLFYFILLMRILFFSKKSTHFFGSLVCLGVFVMIFFQIFVNVGMNLGIIPITGITLPLFSSGGSSLIATLISLGVVQNIGRFSKRKEAIEIK